MLLLKFFTDFTWFLFYYFFKYLFIYLFLERGEAREKDRERNINVWLPLMSPPLGTWPATQPCALTGNQTSDPLLRRHVLNPLSHTSQGLHGFYNKVHIQIWHQLSIQPRLLLLPSALPQEPSAPAPSNHHLVWEHSLDFCCSLCLDCLLTFLAYKVNFSKVFSDFPSN